METLNQNQRKKTQLAIVKMRKSMVMKLIHFIGIVYLLFGLIGCADPFKNKYAGKWIEVNWENDIISIDRNNEDYIVTYQGKRLPAIYKDRNLEVTVGGLNPKMMLDEKTDRVLFLEKEYVRIEKSFTYRVCGVWKFKNNSYDYFKIAKAGYGSFNVQKGHKSGSNINWGNLDGSKGNGENLEFTNGILVGKYRVWEGSAAYSDIIINIELNSNNILLFKGDNGLLEATKISD